MDDLTTWLILAIGGLVVFGPIYPMVVLPGARRVVVLATLTPEEAESRLKVQKWLELMGGKT